MKLNLEELNEDLKKNFIDRMAFVKFWAEYVKSHDDEKWSKAQNVLIDSQFLMSKRFYSKLAETPEGREKIRMLRELKIKK